MTEYRRGQVWFADIGHGDKPFLIVSNNLRNKNLHSALAVRITTTPKPDFPSNIRIPDNECVGGTVLCDDIAELFDGDARDAQSSGSMTPGFMKTVNAGLVSALDIYIPES